MKGMQNEGGRMKHRHRLAAALALLASSFILHPSPSARAAQDYAGANSGASLRFSPSARGAAMGDAFSAEARGVAAIHYNPAGLAFTERGEVELMYQSLVLDVGQGAIGAAFPTGPSGAAPTGAWGVLAQYIDYGQTQRTVVSGTAGAHQGTFTGQDALVALSYGGRLANWGYGATAKFFSSTIDNASATAFAADFGLRWQADQAPVSLGMSVHNLGTSLRFDRKSERLPITFRGGVAWRALPRWLLVTADLEKVASERWNAHVGAELTVAEMLALRAGYDASLQVDQGFTVGAGFRASGLQLDYAFIPFGDFGNNHRVGLNYRF